MIKILYIFFLSLIVTNCSPKKVNKHHGVPLLEKKQSSLVVNKTNKNDIKKILGNPSTKSKFDNDVWIYIERKQSQSKLMNLGKMKITKNNVANLINEVKNKKLLNNNLCDDLLNLYSKTDTLKYTLFIQEIFYKLSTLTWTQDLFEGERG